MVIAHYGFSFVKIQSGETVIVFNPINDLKSGLRPPRFGADIVLVSVNDPRYNGIAALNRGGRSPFVIDGPGEYEVSGVFVRGFATRGQGSLINTVYLLLLGGLRLVHLGAPAEAESVISLKEELGAIDLLFVPIDNPPPAAKDKPSTGVEEKAKIVSELEPKLIIPIHYPDGKMLSAFLKEIGEEETKPVTSFSLKKKELLEQAGKVVVVKSW